MGFSSSDHDLGAVRTFIMVSKSQSDDQKWVSKASSVQKYRRTDIDVIDDFGQAGGGKKRILRGVFGVSGVVPPHRASGPNGSCMTAILGPSGKPYNFLCPFACWNIFNHNCTLLDHLALSSQHNTKPQWCTLHLG